MKNQYVGDISDFRKYGLLRALSGMGAIRTGVCWMLTCNDNRNDGGLISYLDEPEAWRRFDPVVFDCLAECVYQANGRSVKRIEAAGILPNTFFYSNIIQDNVIERHRYFAEMKTELAETDLIFFDPDNGFQIKSCPIGRRDSSKFLFWAELADTYTAGHSVIAYQHFPRIHRESFTQGIVAEAVKQTGAPVIFTFHTKRTFFLLVSQPRHAEHFQRQSNQIARIWENQIQVTRHNTAA